MSDIKNFLIPPIINETKKVIVSERFKGEDGTPIPFVIRVIYQETNEKLYKQASKKTKSNGRVLREIDEDKYGKLLVMACVVEPNLKDAELCAYYKTVDLLDVPGRMLTMGEYSKLVREIRKFNEISTSDEEIEELEEEAKN